MYSVSQKIVPVLLKLFEKMEIFSWDMYLGFVHLLLIHFLFNLPGPPFFFLSRHHLHWKHSGLRQA